MNTLDSTGLNISSFWHSLFAADSIAVIGANDTIGSWGYGALRTAVALARAELKRRVYAVNPNTREIQGVTSYNTILDIPNPVELAVIVVSADIVPVVLHQCVQKKVKAAVIISAGFAEADEAGAKLEAELVRIARRGGMHFVGPNCAGHADTHSRVASNGIAGRIKPGPMALLSQSGTFGASIIQTAANKGIGLSKFVSTGNEADLHLEDYLEYLAQDEDTRIITAYIEGLREGRRFFRLAKDITLKKPIIVIKTGTTNGSSRAARSHTSALAGSDAIYSAAFKQAGVIRADDEEELCDVVIALLNQPLPRGNRIGILTVGGGFGVVTAEACEKEGLRIASFEPQTMDKLNAILPSRWSHGNPVDLVGLKSMAEYTTALSCLHLIMEDKNVDSIISILPPFAAAPNPTRSSGSEQFRATLMEDQKTLDILSQQVKQYGKPLFLIRRSMVQPANEANALPFIPKERIPEYSHPHCAARVLRHLAWYRQYLDYRNRE